MHISRTKAHFDILNWLVRVGVTALFALWFDKQTFVFQKYSVACFDKSPLIMIDKRRRDPDCLSSVALALQSQWTLPSRHSSCYSHSGHCLQGTPLVTVTVDTAFKALLLLQSPISGN